MATAATAARPRRHRRRPRRRDRKSTRLNSSHRCISYAVFCLKKKTQQAAEDTEDLPIDAERDRSDPHRSAEEDRGGGHAAHYERSRAPVPRCARSRPRSAGRGAVTGGVAEASLLAGSDITYPTVWSYAPPPAAQISTRLSRRLPGC